MFRMDENAIDRARGYELLAGIFLKEPSPQVIQVLKAWTESGTTGELLELAGILNRIQTHDPELLCLTQEYYDLFFVPVSGRFLPPFESAIRGAERSKGKKIKYGSHWGSPAHQLSDLYERVGFNPGALNIFEPLKETKIPDHLGLELSFMAYLCRMENKATNAGQEISGIRQLQQRVLENHLLEWLPQFTAELLKLEVSRYYPYFAQLALELCQEEIRFFNEKFERSGISG
ncbi:molecular chaperone TorD family protein [Desulfitobacterium sp.]|uniref:TorD/DmsD family molecular chaperone n=1 Tax=Desulfitobacterium sp. TaxID=49981 RepID=UPI002BE9DC9D|nr:molecular chaperone TorD family protein [Desulfitobacterium sp.]HVJ48183.1 molecular chaperone TorD family protein [Desulfitobacterium sp.]